MHKRGKGAFEINRFLKRGRGGGQLAGCFSFLSLLVKMCSRYTVKLYHWMGRLPYQCIFFCHLSQWEADAAGGGPIHGLLCSSWKDYNL